MSPREEARRRVAGAYDVRVLEPSPPPVTEPPWFADDPAAVGDGRGPAVVAPVTGGATTWDELTRHDDDLRSWCADRWLGGWHRLPPAPDGDRYRAARAAWHALAEHVVAPARHAANGKIGLRFTRGGFGTPFFRTPDGRNAQVRVEGTDLVVHAGAATHREALQSVGAAAALAGIAPGAPAGVYTPTTTLAPDEKLSLDAAGVALLGAWFGFATSVLEQLRADAPADERAATRVQLWPEHFDLSIELGDAGADARGTFGASPGDEDHPEPYLYVTHWARVPPDPFWNDDAFGGASLPLATLAALPDGADQRAAALEFLRRGLRALAGP